MKKLQVKNEPFMVGGLLVVWARDGRYLKLMAPAIDEGMTLTASNTHEAKAAVGCLRDLALKAEQFDHVYDGIAQVGARVIEMEAASRWFANRKRRTYG